MPLSQLGGAVQGAAAEPDDGWESFELTSDLQTDAGGLLILKLARGRGERHKIVETGAVWHVELRKQVPGGDVVSGVRVRVRVRKQVSGGE